MAITKIHAIKTGLTKPLDYIMNEKKTQEKLLVSGYRCAPETAREDFMFQRAYVNGHSMNKQNIGKADIKAYHMIQSFAKTDDLTPQAAHKLGEEWAREVTGGNHQYVIATHVDKGHIHNHVIFNSYSSDTMKKFRSEPYKTAQKLRDVSDRICEENQLHVLENTRGPGQHYKEWLARRDGASWKEKIEGNIERVLLDPATQTYQDYKASLQGLGVEIDERGKYLKYRVSGQGRWSRANGRSLPLSYSHEGIQSRLTVNGEPTLHHITLNQKLVQGGFDEHDSYWTRIPYTSDYVFADREHATWYKGGKTLSVYIESEKTYTIHDKDGFEKREITGAELAGYYDRKERTANTRDEAAPERENRAKVDQREEHSKVAHPVLKTHLRGGLAALRGVAVPIGVMAVREMRKYQIENIQNMALALRTMQNENIKNYRDFESRIHEYAGETMRISNATDALKNERDALTANIGALEIYEKYLPYRQAIEKAGMFQKKKLQEKYDRYLIPLEGAENRLAREGIDPAKTNTEQWNARIEELTGGIRAMEKEERHFFKKIQNLRAGKKEMDRLFIDKGADHEKRYSQQIGRRLQERGHER